MRALEIFWLCFQTSLMSFAGVYGAVSEYARLFVTERGWLTSQQLLEGYVIAQAMPGPNMVLGVVIGYRAGGIGGACSAFAGTYAPAVLVMSSTVATFNRYRRVAWVRRAELALRPLVLGLMIGAAVTILRSQAQTHGALPTALLCAVVGALYRLRVLSPLSLLLFAGVLSWLVARVEALLHLA